MNFLHKQASQTMMDLANTPRGTEEWLKKAENFDQQIKDFLSNNNKLDPVIKKTIYQTKEYKKIMSIMKTLRKIDINNPKYKTLLKEFDANIDKLHSCGYIGLIITK